MSALIRFLFILILFRANEAQFPGLANAVWGPDSLIYGVKNVLGGVLALDEVHSQCLQKNLCSEFSEEVTENSLELDPVKRTYYNVPKVIHRRGRLRWIGDLIVNAMNRVGRRIGIGNRRQSSGLLANAASFAAAKISEIPPEAAAE